MYTCSNWLKHIFGYSFINTQHRHLQKEALESVWLILYNGLVNILLEMYKKVGDNREYTRNWFKCLCKRGLGISTKSIGLVLWAYVFNFFYLRHFWDLTISDTLSRLKRIFSVDFRLMNMHKMTWVCSFIAIFFRICIRNSWYILFNNNTLCAQIKKSVPTME